MGYTGWSQDLYRDRERERVVTNTPTFAHTHAVRTGKAEKKCHPNLDPRGVKLREARDSVEHPESVPIVVLCDVTGSMHRHPEIFQKKLPDLMDILLEKNYCTDPQILVGAIGDHVSDQAPLQVGQFESGIEIDEDIGRLYLEGNGGGSGEESYEMALYFIARHTVTDAWEKRGKKGYLFLTGDEHAYPVVSRMGVQRWLGDNIPADIPLAQIIAEVKEKWNVFFLVPGKTSHTSSEIDRAELHRYWSGLLGPEHVVMLNNAEAISETIGATVGLCEKDVDLARVATDLAGSGTSIVNDVTKGLDGLAKSVALAKAGKGNIPAGVKTAKTTRL